MVLSAFAMPVAFPPSPNRGTIPLGPFRLHAYGVMLALGVVGALTIAERRWRHRYGDPNAVARLAILFGTTVAFVWLSRGRYTAPDPTPSAPVPAPEEGA